MHSLAQKTLVLEKGSTEWLPPRLSWWREIRKWRFRFGYHQAHHSQGKGKEFKMDLCKVPSLWVAIAVCLALSFKQVVSNVDFSALWETALHWHFCFYNYFWAIKKSGSDKGTKIWKEMMFSTKTCTKNCEEYMKSQCHMDLLRPEE